jgi:hypothetical protein
MTVKELIEKLQQFDENLPVAIYEGQYDFYLELPDDINMSVEDFTVNCRPPVKDQNHQYKTDRFLVIH